MKRSLIFLILTLSIIAIPAIKALIIYTSEFSDSDISPLYCTKNAAIELKESLIKLGLAEEKDIRIVSDPTLAKTKYEIESFFEGATREDTLILFFYGHEYYDPETKRTYFTTYDTIASAISDTAYPMDDHLLGFIQKTPAKVLLFIDACYSGSMGNKKTQELSRYSRDILERLARTKRVGFIFSSEPDQVSKGSNEYKTGIFTHYLIEGLKGKADLDGDAKVKLEELAEYLEKEVSRKTKNAQKLTAIISSCMRNFQVSWNYQELEMKALEEVKEKGAPDKVKSAIDMIISRSPDVDAGWQVEARKFVWKRGMGRIDYDTFVEMMMKIVPDSVCVKLHISTEPSGAEIYIDGKKAPGTTPLTVSITTGKHRIKIVKEHYITLEKTIELGKEEEYHELKFTLEKRPYGLIVKLPDELKLNTSVQLKVKVKYFDGVYDLKSSDIQYSASGGIKIVSGEVLAIKPGRAKITVEYKGVKETKEVKIYTGEVYIRTEPSGAEVYVDGEKAGKTPIKFRLYSYSSVVKLVKYGYEEEKITVKAGDKKYVKLKTIVTDFFISGVPNNVFYGDSIKPTFKLKTLTGEEITLNPSEVVLNVKNADYRGEKIIFTELGRVFIEVEYKDKKIKKEVKVLYALLDLNVNSSPENAKVYLDGRYIGTTPLEKEIKLATKKNSVKLEVVKGNLNIEETFTVHRGRNRIEYSPRFDEIYEKSKDTLIRILSSHGSGEINTALKTLEKEYDIDFTKESVDEILSELKEFDEYKINDVKTITDGDEVLKESALSYLKEVKDAIKFKNAKKLAGLIEGIYPDVAKELLRTEKPWAWAFKVAFENKKKKLVELLEKNALEEGVKIKKVEELEGNLGELEDGLKEWALGLDGLSLGLVSGVDGLYVEGIPLSIVYLLNNNLIVGGYLGYGEAISFHDNAYGGHLSIGAILGKPPIIEDDIWWWYVGIGTQLIPLSGRSTFTSIKIGVGWASFGIGALLAITPDGIYSGVYLEGALIPLIGFYEKTGEKKTIIEIK